MIKLWKLQSIFIALVLIIFISFLSGCYRLSNEEKAQVKTFAETSASLNTKILEGYDLIKALEDKKHKTITSIYRQDKVKLLNGKFLDIGDIENNGSPITSSLCD